MFDRLKTRSISLVVAAASALLPASTPSEAAVAPRPNVPIVRDAEIESLVADYAGPILKAAGLSRSGIEIVLVNSPQFNAFVAGRRIFINTGTIAGSQTPNEVIGVLAHEMGHLAGGHQQRLRDQLERAQTIAIVAGLLGAGVAAAGAVSGAPSVARLGSGIFAGGGSVAQRGLLSYQRSEETTADRSALTYLQKSGQSPRGLIRTFEGLARQSLLAGVSSNQYLSSHPAPRDRITLLQTLARESPYYDKADDPALQLRHDLARAKIAAYADGALSVRRMFAKDPRGIAASYGDAISAHLSGSPTVALRKIDDLIAKQPNTPWFHEVRGEVLMEAGRSKEAAAAFRKAASLDKSKSGLLEASIGQALVTGGDPSRMPEAIGQIKKGLAADPSNSTAYRFLAMAYNQVGDIPSAELATAEGYWHAGSLKQARLFAARAQIKLKPGSPQWLQAQDIITTK